MTDVLDGFESTTFEFDGKTREVLRSGSGPAVIVIAEMPGITPACSPSPAGSSTSAARRCCRPCSARRVGRSARRYALQSIGPGVRLA